MQYIETIYYKKTYKEWPSEFGADISRENKTFSDIIASVIFNDMYGIFYYEPASETEAIKMINEFKEKIKELEAKYIGKGDE